MNMKNTSKSPVAGMTAKEFDAAALPIYNDARIPNVDAELLRHVLMGKINSMDDIHDVIKYLHHMPEAYDIYLFDREDLMLTRAHSRKLLEDFLLRMEGISDWKAEIIDAAAEEYCSAFPGHEEAVKYVLLLALNGKTDDLGTFGELSELLLKQEAIRRIRVAISKLS